MDEPSSAPARDAEGVQRQLDRISLEQALADFETANARQIELTERLVEAEREIERLQATIHSSRHPVGAAVARGVRLVRRAGARLRRR